MNLKYLLPLTCLMSFSSLAEVHKWVDEHGNTHYSDTKPEHIKTTEFKVKPHINSNPTSYQKRAASITPEAKTSKANPYKKKHKVVMYAASWCGYCKKARAFFRKHKIRYTEFDIEKNAAAKSRYEKFGGTGVPLIVSGSKKMQGFSEARFERFYLDL